MDRNYWCEFYETLPKTEISFASSFARFCQEKYFHDNSRRMIELGCGNGRDAVYFANHNHVVHAIDQCVIEMSEIRTNLHFLQDDFVNLEYDSFKEIDTFYSRFTLHSITQEEEEKLLFKVHDNLSVGGLFCIESRTTKDPKFGIGRCVEHNTYLHDNHRRRFVDSESFLQRVLKMGFKLRYFTEENNLSIHKGDNPVLMRIILEK